jgi:DNA-directed RNA polymerase specialized sigma24 family protein
MSELSPGIEDDLQAPDRKAFHTFLHWLDEGKETDGRSYLEMRERLVAYFDRKNCLNADDLADSTLTRVSRRLNEEGSIDCETPAKYCYIVARYVFLEHTRNRREAELPLDDVLSDKQEIAAREESDEREDKEKTFGCLERCMEQLKQDDRETVIRYYYGKERVKIENRRALADNLGISLNALRIRACRIRDRLEGCVEKCMTKD